jgi:phosphoserine phosphatase
MMVGAAIFHLARGLAERGFFSGRDVARFTSQQLRLRLSGESHARMHRSRACALPFVAGKNVEEILVLGEQIYDEQLADRIWPGTHALARLHLAAGQRVWLVTAAPVELATIIACRLGLTGALGTVAEAARPLHRPAGRAGAARPGEGRRGPGPGGAGGARPRTLRRTRTRSTTCRCCVWSGGRWR